MKELIVTMGISGSGKSRYSCEYDEYDPHGGASTIRVNMDDLRKLYTGNISDQTQNRRVAEDAFAITRYLLFKGLGVIFDSTGTRADTRNKLLSIAREQGAKTTLVVFMDSMDIDLCMSRVARDISAGVDRSRTSDDRSILERQHASFVEALKVIDTEGWGSIVFLK